MNIKKISRTVMSMRGMTNKNVADECGYSTASGFSNILSRGNGMRVDSLIKILTVLDCEVVVRTNNCSDEWKIEEE